MIKQSEKMLYLTIFLIIFLFLFGLSTLLTPSERFDQDTPTNEVGNLENINTTPSNEEPANPTENPPENTQETETSNEQTPNSTTPTPPASNIPTSGTPNNSSLPNLEIPENDLSFDVELPRELGSPNTPTPPNPLASDYLNPNGIKPNENLSIPKQTIIIKITPSGFEPNFIERIPLVDFQIVFDSRINETVFVRSGGLFPLTPVLGLGQGGQIFGLNRSSDTLSIIGRQKGAVYEIWYDESPSPSLTRPTNTNRLIVRFGQNENSTLNTERNTTNLDLGIPEVGR